MYSYSREFLSSLEKFNSLTKGLKERGKEKKSLLVETALIYFCSPPNYNRRLVKDVCLLLHFKRMNPPGWGERATRAMKCGGGKAEL